jgi:hypothetical protein
MLFREMSPEKQKAAQALYDEHIKPLLSGDPQDGLPLGIADHIHILHRADQFGWPEAHVANVFFPLCVPRTYLASLKALMR